MLIAVPNSEGRVSPVLDTAVRLLLVTRRRGKEVERKEFVLNPLPPEGLARSVAELRVDVLLCAALSEQLLRALERRGVPVKPHLCGEVELVLRLSTAVSSSGMNSACRAAGDNICTAEIAVASALRSMARLAGKKT